MYDQTINEVGQWRILAADEARPSTDEPNFVGKISKTKVPVIRHLVECNLWLIGLSILTLLSGNQFQDGDWWRHLW
jgi:hypothetical protein